MQGEQILNIAVQFGLVLAPTIFFFTGNKTLTAREILYALLAGLGFVSVGIVIGVMGGLSMSDIFFLKKAIYPMYVTFYLGNAIIYGALLALMKCIVTSTSNIKNHGRQS